MIELTTTILHTHLERRQNPFNGRRSGYLSVGAIPGSEENGIDNELLTLMLDSLMLSNSCEAYLEASGEISLDTQTTSLQAGSLHLMSPTLPLECTICGESVQDDNSARVEDGSALHLQCCLSSPPPSYSSGSSSHPRSNSATGVRSIPYRDSAQILVQGPHNLGNTLPIELWEMVIDALVDEPAALITCAFVCKFWYSRVRTYLSQGVLQLNTHRDVFRLSKYVQAHRAFASRELVTISGDPDGSLLHLPTFTALLAGRMPCLESLEVEHGVWQAGMTDIDFFTRTASFTSISRLTLNDMTFPSTSIFAQFICSFERLTELYLVNVRTVKKRTGPQLYLPLTCRSKLCHLAVTGPQVHDLVEFFTTAGLADKLVHLTLHVGYVGYRRIVWLDAGAFHNLLAACHSLHALHLQYRDDDDTEAKDGDADNILGASSPVCSHQGSLMDVLPVYYLDAAIPHPVESLRITIEPHPRSDCKFRRMTDILSYINMTGTLRELVIIFDIQGETDEAAHQRLLVVLSDETDLMALDEILRSYAKLESVEIALRVGHLESRLVKSREAIWMERIETQMQGTRLRGILS